MEVYKSYNMSVSYTEYLPEHRQVSRSGSVQYGGRREISLSR
jgi:hypothetical protein